MKAGAIALAEVWGGNLKEVSSSESPDKVLNNLNNEKGLFVLNGDAAICLPGGGSWIESFGNWKYPIILVVSASTSGEIPGVGKAYVALCNQYSVPLVGIVQLGGAWLVNQKRLDNLPWCGWLPDKLIEHKKNDNYFMDSYIVRENLRNRLYEISS